MAKVLSLTASEVGALMNLLEAPEIDLPGHPDLKRIYEKINKVKSTKVASGIIGQAPSNVE